ncbi:MAG: ABC transporter permease [Kiloniellales bacterium]|nr:ABC transporter permease [Kiloniellales bacterium]
MSAELAWVVPTLLTVIGASTPLLLAGLGELVTEKSGVLNLGVEGMMLIGAVAAFAAGVTTGSWILAILAGALAGMGLAFLFGVLTLSLLANQVATGLALTIFGIGLSALLGAGFVGTPYPGLPKLDLPLLSDLPVLGPLVFGHDLLVYLSVLMVGLVAWFLARTKAGLVLRAVGENQEAAHAIGYPVIATRYLAVLFGGLMSGLGGAYLSLAYTPMWAENMTAGRGWIALALVVFSTWKPARVLLGAYIFGGVTILQLHAQGIGIEVPSQILSMLPYLATILVLVLISRDSARLRLNAPACLGKVFHPAA